MLKDCKNQKELKKYVKEVVDRIGVCESILDYHPSNYEFFISLFERHSDYPDKFVGMIDIKIQYNPVYKKQLEVIIIKQNGQQDDVSVFKNCITGKPKDNLTIAMRNSIIPQIIKYKKDNLPICVKCGNTENIEVDHHTPQFVDLKDGYIKSVDEKIIPLEFKQNDSHSKIFENKDNKFEKDWCIYHEKNAKLRILCKKCNSTRSKSKRVK